MSGKCPVCSSVKTDILFPKYQGKCITSQLFFIDNIILDNRICRNCGFIFNMQGIRGKEAEVYSSGVWKPKPQVMSFGKNVKTTHERALDTFRSLLDIPESGELLDFGAGTGAFLDCFHQAFPGWNLTAIEPGGGYEQLKKNPIIAQAYNSPYYMLDLAEQYDAVVVMSVLEHVADPLAALRWIFDHLKPNGLLLMQHPNFAMLPGDLFCADHINKMTTTFTKELCRCAGFSLINENSEMLPFYQAFTRGDHPEDGLPACYEENRAIATECEHISTKTMEAVERAVGRARKSGRKAAVFGTSPIGSMAPLFLDCADSISCFVDENPHVWGRDVEGLPVVGPEKMAEFGVSDLALAVSPLYWDVISAKMQKFSVSVHIPQI